MLEVDKKHLHEVRRQIEANAIRIYSSLVNSSSSITGERLAITRAVEYAISIRKEIDEKIKEKEVAPTTPSTTGDIDKL